MTFRKDGETSTFRKDGETLAKKITERKPIAPRQTEGPKKKWEDEEKHD
jgi:hypothetical protein